MMTLYEKTFPYWCRRPVQEPRQKNAQDFLMLGVSKKNSSISLLSYKTEIMLEKPFQVLPHCDHHSFDIHFEKTPQAKSPQTVKLFRFPKQRLDPHTPFAHGFQISFRVSVSLGFVEILLGE
jgi:hypothetical protein